MKPCSGQTVILHGRPMVIGPIEIAGIQLLNPPYVGMELGRRRLSRLLPRENFLSSSERVWVYPRFSSAFTPPLSGTVIRHVFPSLRLQRLAGEEAGDMRIIIYVQTQHLTRG
jgi:hypothetical protein